MKRWHVVLLLFFLVAAVTLAWQTPAILKAMPSRYVARLPEPVQALGEREHVDVLPTAAVPVDTAMLSELAGDTEAAPLPPVVMMLESAASPTAGSGTVSQTPVPTPSPLPSATAPLPTSTPLPIPSAARLEGIRHHFQDWNNCGPATLAMTLSYFDVDVTQRETARFLKPNPEDRNVTPEEMAAYVLEETQLEALARRNGTLETVKRLVSNQIPVIVEVGIDPPGEYRWMGWYGHYLLVVAYADEPGQVWVYDSWFGTSEVPGENADPDGRVLSYAELDRAWQQFNRSYIALYETGQRDLLNDILGADVDDTQMWSTALTRNQEELRADPENAFLWFNLGSTYNALEDYEKAATAFDQARAIGLPWRMLWYQFGPYEAYYETGRYEEVVALADVTLQDRPYFEESYYYKANALNALGDRAAARENLERALNFNPRFAQARQALAALTEQQ